MLPFCFALLGFASHGQTPGFAWVKKAGGSGYDGANAISVDTSGNSYVTGSFAGTASFGGITLTGSGGDDVFITKYDASGNILWAKQAGGSNYDGGNGIAVDGSGNSYVTGYFQGTASFGNTTLVSSGNEDVFIAKYDASGNLLWVKQAGGSGYDAANAVAIDGNGNSYITGYFAGVANFGSTTLTSSGGNDVFIAKYSTSGSLLWAKRAGGSNYDESYGIAVDGNSNCYITGYFGGTTFFGSTTLTSSGLQDVFIAKYDGSGNLLWAKQAGGTLDEKSVGITVDASGNSYITGYFVGTSSFGSTTLTSSGSSDVFIAKYDPTGNVLWAKQAGGASHDVSNSIAVDGNGNSYITGYFDSTAIFGNTTLISSGSDDVFMAKYTASGNLLWAKQAGGTGSDRGDGIALDGNGNSYIAGTFYDTASFGSITIISNATYDVFLTKINSGGIVTYLTMPIAEHSNIVIAPNPVERLLTIKASSTDMMSVAIMNAKGDKLFSPVQFVSSTTIDMSSYAAGVYLIEVVNEKTGEKIKKKIVKE